jgi:glycosyltransferase involved in cell wall biosynthesis
LGAIKRRISHFVIKHANLYLAQTKSLNETFQKSGLSNVKWYPTSRFLGKNYSVAKKMSSLCRRFIYVGHVREYKGMRVLAQAAEHLPDGVTIDIFGPWFDDLDRNIFDNNQNIKYCGILNPEDVIATMSNYHAAVLPTLAQTEGYPGMILESYAAGLPIIASKVGGIPEIVDDSVGILVEPNNVEDLIKSMSKMVNDEAFFQKLRSNTFAKAQSLSSEHWATEFVNFCHEIRQSSSVL